MHIVHYIINNIMNNCYLTPHGVSGLKNKLNHGQDLAKSKIGYIGLCSDRWDNYIMMGMKAKNSF